MAVDKNIGMVKFATTGKKSTKEIDNAFADLTKQEKEKVAKDITEIRDKAYNLEETLADDIVLRANDILSNYEAVDVIIDKADIPDLEEAIKEETLNIKNGASVSEALKLNREKAKLLIAELIRLYGYAGVEREVLISRMKDKVNALILDDKTYAKYRYLFINEQYKAIFEKYPKTFINEYGKEVIKEGIIALNVLYKNAKGINELPPQEIIDMIMAKKEIFPTKEYYKIGLSMHENFQEAMFHGFIQYGTFTMMEMICNDEITMNQLTKLSRILEYNMGNSPQDVDSKEMQALSKVLSDINKIKKDFDENNRVTSQQVIVFNVPNTDIDYNNFVEFEKISKFNYGEFKFRYYIIATTKEEKGKINSGGHFAGWVDIIEEKVKIVKDHVKIFDETESSKVMEIKRMLDGHELSDRYEFKIQSIVQEDSKILIKGDREDE